MEIKTVTILGANGQMGMRVAGIFASFGNAKVYLVCRNLDKAIRASITASESVKASVVRTNLLPADYSMISDIVPQSDLVFESVAEEMDVKQDVLSMVSPLIHNQAILCTGTSGLSINELALSIPETLRNRFLGLHFYNPPYSLPLCELIPSGFTSPSTKERIKEYASIKLHRTVVLVEDRPGFLGNRIGFHFINSAIQYADIHKSSGGIDYIDSIFGQFTGRSMAPLVTSDYVGLDVHKAIVDNIYQNTDDYSRHSFVLPDFVNTLISRNHLGRKTKCGLYKREKTEEGYRYLVYDIATDTYREVINYSFAFASKMIDSLHSGDYSRAIDILFSDSSTEARICVDLLLEYVLYGLYASRQVSSSVHSADDVMAMGFNWCPPLAVVDALGGKKKFLEVLKKRANSSLLNEVNVDRFGKEIEESEYDYRRFFRANQ